MFEANEATRIFPWRSGKIERNASPTSRSDPVFPGRSAFVESPRRRSTPRFPISARAPDVGLEPVDGRVVELPVSRVHDPPGGRLDHERGGVGNRVRDANELDAERAELERCVAGLCGDELGLLPEPVLVELRLHERERQRRRVDGVDLDLAQQVRQPADVILVPVREDHCTHAPPLEVADVGQQEIHAEVLVAREREPRVDDDDLVPRSRRRSCSCRPRRGRRAE